MKKTGVLRLTELRRLRSILSGGDLLRCVCSGRGEDECGGKSHPLNRMIVKLFVHFRALSLRYLQRTAHWMQISDFDDIFKTLTISHLNFVDMYFVPQTGLKGPKQTCKKATVATQLWPFRLSTVALLQVRRGQTGNQRDFFDFPRPVPLSGWRIPMGVFLLRLFVFIRHFVEKPFTNSCWQVGQISPHRISTEPFGSSGNNLLSLHGRFAVIAVLFFQLSVEAPKGGDEEKVGHDPGHRIAEAHAEEAEGRHEPQAHSAAGYHLHHAREH